MRDKLYKKVKRPRANWFDLLQRVNNPDAWKSYYLLMKKHPDMSSNRLAYNALKHHYSSRYLDYFRWMGEPMYV